MTRCQGTKAGSLPRVCELPDYRWVVTGQEIIVRPEDVGEPEGVPVANSGLTFAENGDLLMAVIVVDRSAPHGPPPQGPPRMVLLRSADRGHTWSQQGRLDYRVTEVGGECFSGLIRLASGRLVGVLLALDQEVHVAKYPQPGDVYFIEGGHNIRFDRLRSAQCGCAKDEQGAFGVVDGPVGEQKPGFQSGTQQAHFDQPHVLAPDFCRPFPAYIGFVGQA